jgi:serine/threonine-protein kinase RsbW
MITTETARMESIEFSSKGDNITIVERLIDELCDKYKIQEEHYGNILIALTEAANNAIYHGNKQDSSKKVVVHYNASPDTFFFRIEDEGPGFDFDNVPDPTSPENIEKPNGRGVFLMKHLSDDLKFLEDGRIAEITFKNLSKPVSISA